MVSAFYVVSNSYSCNNTSFVDASVDITIKKGGSNVHGTAVATVKGEGLARPINCSLDNSNLGAKLTWKHQNNIVQDFTSGQQPNIYQVNEKHSQRLYIIKTDDSDVGVYSCEISVENATLLSKSFTLIVGMLLCCLFSCMTVVYQK